MKVILLIAALFIMEKNVSAQDTKPVTRIARITIDPSNLEIYKAFLKEQMEAAVLVEPGVISYTVYADKDNPAKLTLVEIYANNKAYLAHRETPHFKKYKAAVADMVKSLELSEVDAILTLKKENKQ
ncbi:putative quinol monooxygenase [Flavitalea flava]